MITPETAGQANLAGWDAAFSIRLRYFNQQLEQARQRRPHSPQLHWPAHAVSSVARLSGTWKAWRLQATDNPFALELELHVQDFMFAPSWVVVEPYKAQTLVVTCVVALSWDEQPGRRVLRFHPLVPEQLFVHLTGAPAAVPLEYESGLQEAWQHCLTELLDTTLAFPLLDTADLLNKPLPLLPSAGPVAEVAFCVSGADEDAALHLLLQTQRNSLANPSVTGLSFTPIPADTEASYCLRDGLLLSELLLPTLSVLSPQPMPADAFKRSSLGRQITNVDLLALHPVHCSPPVADASNQSAVQSYGMPWMPGPAAPGVPPVAPTLLPGSLCLSVGDGALRAEYRNVHFAWRDGVDLLHSFSFRYTLDSTPEGNLRIIVQSEQVETKQFFVSQAVATTDQNRWLQKQSQYLAATAAPSDAARQLYGALCARTHSAGIVVKANPTAAPASCWLQMGSYLAALGHTTGQGTFAEGNTTTLAPYLDSQAKDMLQQLTNEPALDTTDLLPLLLLPADSFDLYQLGPMLHPAAALAQGLMSGKAADSLEPARLLNGRFFTANAACSSVATRLKGLLRLNLFPPVDGGAMSVKLLDGCLQVGLQLAPPERLPDEAVAGQWQQQRQRQVAQLQAPALAQFHHDLQQLVQTLRPYHPVLSVSKANAPTTIQRVLEQVQTTVDQQRAYWYSAPSQAQIWQAQQQQRQVIETLLQAVGHDAELPRSLVDGTLFRCEPYVVLSPSSFNRFLMQFLLVCRLQTENPLHIAYISAELPYKEQIESLVREIASHIEAVENSSESSNLISLLHWAASQTYPVQRNPNEKEWSRHRSAVRRLQKIAVEAAAESMSSPRARALPETDYFALFNEHLLWLRLADEPDEALLRQGYQLLKSVANVAIADYRTPLKVHVPTVNAILALSPYAPGSLHQVCLPEVLAAPARDLKSWLSDVLRMTRIMEDDLLSQLLYQSPTDLLAAKFWREILFLFLGERNGPVIDDLPFSYLRDYRGRDPKEFLVGWLSTYYQTFPTELKRISLRAEVFAENVLASLSAGENVHEEHYKEYAYYLTDTFYSAFHAIEGGAQPKSTWVSVCQDLSFLFGQYDLLASAASPYSRQEAGSAELYRFVRAVSEGAERERDPANSFFIDTYRTFAEEALYSTFSSVTKLTPALTERLQEWGERYMAEIRRLGYHTTHPTPMEVLSAQLQERMAVEASLHKLPQPLVADWVAYDEAGTEPIDVATQWQTWAATHNGASEVWNHLFHIGLKELRQRYPNLPAFSSLTTAYEAFLTTYAELLGYLNQRASLQLLRRETSPLWQSLYDNCLAHFENYETAGLGQNSHLRTFHHALLKSWLLDTEAVLEQDEAGLPKVFNAAPCAELATMAQLEISALQSDYGQFNRVLTSERKRLHRKLSDTPLSLDKIAELTTRIDSLTSRLHTLTRVAVASS